MVTMNNWNYIYRIKNCT